MLEYIWVNIHLILLVLIVVILIGFEGVLEYLLWLFLVVATIAGLFWAVNNVMAWL